MSVFVTVLIDAFSLTIRSNRIEKQISDIQAKSEEKKMAVSFSIGLFVS